MIKSNFIKLFGSPKKAMVSFVGAGGKSSLMHCLRSECIRHYGSVLVTTTTKMYASQLNKDCPLILDRDPCRLNKRLASAFGKYRLVATGKELTQDNKVIGITPEEVDDLYVSGICDYILVEADGARGKSLKAPAPYEPRIPKKASHVFVVVGIDVLGMPLIEKYVHRHEIVAKIANQEAGTAVNVFTLLSVLRYYCCIVKTFLPDTRLYSVINKVDNDLFLKKARDIAKIILSHSDIDVVLITSTRLPQLLLDVVV